MWSVCEEEGEDSHIETSLVKKIEVAYRRCPYGNGTACPDAAEDPGYQDAIPRGTVASYQIGNGSQQIAAQVDRTAAIDIRKGHH